MRHSSFHKLARLMAVLPSLGGALPLVAQTITPPALDQHIAFTGGYVGVGVFEEKVFAATETGVVQYPIDNLEDGPEEGFIAGGSTRDFGARDPASGFFVNESTEGNLRSLVSPAVTNIVTNTAVAVTSSTPSGHFGILTTEGTIDWRQADFTVIQSIDVPSEILGFFDGSSPRMLPPVRFYRLIRISFFREAIQMDGQMWISPIRSM